MAVFGSSYFIVYYKKYTEGILENIVCIEALNYSMVSNVRQL